MRIDLWQTNNLGVDNPKVHLYRIFSVERMFELLERSELVLVRPKLWEDPFENFLLRCNLELDTGERIDLRNEERQFYGQCWSLKRESDAMWRIYSPQKNGVKIKVRSGNLLSCLYPDSGDNFIGLKAWIGKVSYHNQKVIEQMVRDPRWFKDKLLDTSGREPVETLLFKRFEFSHEKEVRIIFRDIDEGNGNDLVKFRIDPFELIEEIIFDPRMSPFLVEAYKGRLKEIGFPGKVDQSSLYKVPRFNVLLKKGI
jgi:hypothetical protein